ncbi:MAG: aspartate--tRNA ligase [Pseudomonadota bacterium]
MHAYRSHTCADLRSSDVGSTVKLSGWIHRKRDHGGVLFVDLRDHFGLTQLVAAAGSESLKTLDSLRSESVVTISGTVVAREGGAVNKRLATGDIEVQVKDVVVQSAAAELPMPVAGEAEYPEEIRLKYRYLDLRREQVHANIMLRSAVIASIRRRMIEQGFTEFQTPILTASSPEGARDYLVPSRVHPGKFYALPQAPQMFKQLLMVAGFDRYFQIAPCFRDEDARADRSPGEFYQLDFEMSFVTQDDVFNAIEPVLSGVFAEFAEGKFVTPAKEFVKIPFSATMNAFGTDKPDLRNPLVMANVTDVFSGSGFKIFADRIAADPNYRVYAVPAPGGGSRAFCDRMNTWAQAEGQPGLAYVFWRAEDGEPSGPVAKNLGPERTKLLQEFIGNEHSVWAKLPYGLPAELKQKYLELRPNGFQPGDGVFFVGGVPKDVASFAGTARTRVAEQLELVEAKAFRFCWIVDFPMYEKDGETGKIDFSHNPFSMPNYPLDAFLELDSSDEDTIRGITAWQYDIVCNGVELSSGAIRNHRPDIMYKAFEIAGYSKAEVDTNFPGMIGAFKFGAPPHGGSAPGIDRIVMLLADEPNIREVIAFPMNQKAEDLLMNAPAPVTEKQLRELSIRVVADS